MTKTLSRLEQIVEAYGLEWDEFTESLEERDQEAFSQLLNRAKHHAEAGSKVERNDLFESIIMSILVDHQRELSHMQKKLFLENTKTCPRCGKTTNSEEFFKGETLEEGMTILCQDCRELLYYNNRGG